MRIGITIFFVTALLIQAQPIIAEENQVAGPGEGHSGVKQVQPELIRFTMIEFREYETIKKIHEQMYSIPGVTDFVPYLETPGLLTYDLRYSGPATLLVKALQDVFGMQYEIAIKEIGEKSWEITMRRSGQPID